MIAASVLKTNYMCVGLTDDQCAQIGSLAEVHQCPSGHLLTRIDEEATHMYIVLGGNLTVTTYDGDKLGDIGTGSIVGEISLIDGRPRTANVVCVGPCSVGAIPLADLRRLLRDNPETGFLVLTNIARVLATRLRNANAVIDHLSDKAEDPWERHLG